jgi:putative phosphoesterase
MMREKTIQIGLISDTHGLLRQEAVVQLHGSELILHAGDIGSPDILDELGRITRVVAVRGNNDRAAWAHHLPERETIEVCGMSIFMLHDVNEMDGSCAPGAHDIVIAGHSHRPLIERRNGVLFVNPGSAGPRRFDLPVTVARLRIGRKDAQAQVIKLDV